MKKNNYTKIRSTILFIAVLITSSAFSQGVPELLYYKFNTGDTIINYASSPVGTNPTSITGTTLTVGSTGLDGTALVGTGGIGSSNKIATGWNTSFTGSFTIAFWTSSIPTSSTLYYIFGDVGAASFRCFTNGVAGANNWMVRGGGLPDLIITGAATSTPNMIHVVRDLTAGTYKSYKNGVLITTINTTASFSTAGSGFTVGVNGSSTGLSGKMDEFRIYNRALGVAEILTTYNVTLPLSVAGDAGISAFVVPSDTVCNNDQPVTVTLKNYGTTPIDSVKINWKINNIAQTVFNWTGTLAGGNTTNVVIGNYNFLSNSTYEIIAATSDPNGSTDILTSNDTLMLDSIYVLTGPTLTPALTTLNSCAGDTIVLGGTLTGTGPWNIDVYDGYTTSNFNNISTPAYALSILPAATSTYTLTVTDSTGCTYYSAPSLAVTVDPLPPAVITTLSNTTFCYGDTAILNANLGIGFAYQWQNNGSSISGATDSTFNAIPSGNYTAVVIDSNGCEATSNVIQVLAYALPIVNLGNDTSIGMAFNKVLDAGSGFVSYLWSTGDTIQSITVDTNGVGLGLTAYWVHVTDANCSGGDTINVTWITNPGFSELQNKEIFNVYPNPAKDKLFLSTTGINNNYVISIYDMKGQLIYSKNLKSNHLEIDISNWSSGFYQIVYHSESKYIVKKLIIE